CAEADLVIEAAPEKLGLKQDLFASVEDLAKASAILASNTSSLPIGQIGERLTDPGRLIGLHFFNPVLQMPLVELIPSPRTRPEVTARAEGFARGLGKTVVHSADRPGFVTTRALAALLNEAIGMLEEGVATRDDIDTAYKLGFHHPLGPFELADLVGLDTALAILEVLREGLQDSPVRGPSDASPAGRRRQA
ncbi:3-hydroxybutyryl-CoA dehydrogenase, partial [mine drainage metagenome]